MMNVEPGHGGRRPAFAVEGGGGGGEGGSSPWNTSTGLTDAAAAGLAISA